MDNLNIKKAYILGCTNAGKSTLINTMLASKTITTSRIPNTTLDFINLYIEDKILTDTPGFVTTTTPFITDKKYYKKMASIKMFYYLSMALFSGLISIYLMDKG